jgi:transposase
MAIAVLGIDLGKNSCSVVGLDGTGQVMLRRRMQRKSIAVLGAKLSPCIIAMEACCGAHHLGRVLSTLGHTVRLMSPEYVRPYVKAQKNDDRDAEAIAEAATRVQPCASLHLKVKNNWTCRPCIEPAIGQ